MANMNLTELLAQRAEATGAEEGRAPFDFTATGGKKKGEPLRFTIRDNMFFSEADWDELNEVGEENDFDLLAEFWMGEKEYERFREAGGTPQMILMIVQEKAKREQAVDADGRPTRSNRSQRRAAARKR